MDPCAVARLAELDVATDELEELAVREDAESRLEELAA